MVFVSAILIYCFLVILKRLLKPRTLPRRCDYDLSNNLLFMFICGMYALYKLSIDNMTIQSLRNFSVFTTKWFYLWNDNCFYYYCLYGL